MPDPMYRQIAEDLRQKIESGELGHGAQLPTELELREQHEASRNTVRDAIKLLITRGLVETRPGQGTFVVEKIDPFVTTLSELETGLGGGEGVSYASQVQALGRKPTTTRPRVEIQAASEMIETALHLAKGTTVVSRHQQRFIDGVPWSLQTTFYPMRFVEAGAVRLIQAEDIPEGVVKYLGTQLGIKQAGLPRQHHRPAAGPQRDRVLQVARRRPHSGGGSAPHRVQRECRAAEAHQQRLPH